LTVSPVSSGQSERGALHEILRDIVVCPYCVKEDLEFFPVAGTGGEEAILYCSVCNRWYPVRNCILCILPDHLRPESDGAWIERRKAALPSHIRDRLQNETGKRHGGGDAVTREKRKEMSVRDEQAREYEKLKKAHRIEIELAAIHREIGSMKDRVVFDIGCGVGKFVKRYAPVYNWLVGIDFSYESLLLLKRDIEKRKPDNIVLMQADACFLPVRDNVADLVISSQVFQHLPGDRQRNDFLDGIYRITKENGSIAMTVYNHSYEIRRAIANGTSPEIRAKEGLHSNGKIFYHCFDHDELTALLEPQFQLNALYGLINQIPKVSYKMEGSRFYLVFDRILQRIPLSKKFGLLLMASFKKKHEGTNRLESPS